MTVDNDSFAALLQASEKKPLKKLETGQKLKATIVGIDGETMFLDVGTKSEGIIDSSEFLDSDGKLSVAIGDAIDVYCLKSGPSGLIFTARLGKGAGSAHLEEAWRSGVPVEGLVKAEIKGGFEITLSGSVRAFCPYSQMGLRRVENAAEEYLGTSLTVVITRYEADGRNIVVSARALQEEENRLKKEALRETLEPGQTVDGVISSIRTFGLFVDIGGVDGLVPLSEVGWSRVENLSDLYHAGQAVSVVIKELDWENERISLSIKETLEDPWDKAVTGFPAGSSHVGIIARLAPFGAFVTLAPGVDGLIHISKLGQGRKINHPREVVEEGQSIEVVIESVESDSRRISLAPADYTSAEDLAEKEREVYKSFAQNSKAEKKSGDIGTFGELLRKKLEQKKS